MATHSQQFLGFLTRLKKTRYLSTYLHSSISNFPFSTQNCQLDTLGSDPSLTKLNNQSNIDERYILRELSDLLPISHKASIARSYELNQSTKQSENRGVVADCYLSPEDKLRGVFLQKLKGKSAIENALGKIGVDLSIDVVANVLDRGNLGGEAMIIFFNWAIKQPTIPKDIHSYNVLIRALGRRKFIDFVLKVLVDLKAEDINVNLETLSIVMDSLLRARQVYKAIQMFGNSESLDLNVILNL
ncbi:hypothetical protein RCOM_1601600 [Ricinus communis]|uniref:Pentatricopeptide repeat-containing protein n=1 Tax=Ricinus communis TaxID=3988 RepID=B9R8Q1_RICCO|nr:hypothetical protein RCOM_1601600 [Ricinus communis]